MIFTDIFPDKFHSVIFRAFEENASMQYPTLLFENNRNILTTQLTIKSWESPVQMTISQTMEIGYMVVHYNGVLLESGQWLDNFYRTISFLKYPNTIFLYYE